MSKLLQDKVAPTRVTHRPVVIGEYVTGALDIETGTGRRILSIPSQLGCRVGCTFCVSSKTPLIRNLTAAEMLHIIKGCLEALPPDGRPLELSFTGEGEPLLNWKQTEAVSKALDGLSPEFSALRYCFSGIGADKLLAKIDTSGRPVRLQFSLHAARQAVRDKMVPKSLPLLSIETALFQHAERFAGVELNVVLQSGINDQEDDLHALANWGSPRWPILLNPLLSDARFEAHSNTRDFEQRLVAAGRVVRRYSQVAQSISEQKAYIKLTAWPTLT